MDDTISLFSKWTIPFIFLGEVMVDPPAPPEVAKPTMRDFTIWQAMKSKVYKPPETRSNPYPYTATGVT